MAIIKHIRDAYTIGRNLPVNYQAGELDFCKAEFSYLTNSVDLHECKNVLITRLGCVYTNRSKIEKNSLKQSTETTYAYLHLAKSLLTKKRVKLNDNENYLIAFDIYTDGFYHWFCDFLPRILALGSETENYVLIIPASAYNKNTGIEVLNFFRIKFKDILFINEQEYFTCKKCFLISAPCITGRIDDIQMQKVKMLIDTNIVSRVSTTEATALTYISRSKARYRHLLNETALLPLLKDYGFDIIHFEDYSFMEQVRLAAGSKLLMGLHGAGLTNMLFMKEGSLVSEFKRDKIYHNQCYWHLADSLHLHYAYLLGEADSNKPLEGSGSNLTVSVKQLTTHLDWLVKEKFI